MDRKKDDISRRQVLKGAGIFALGSAIPGCESLSLDSEGTVTNSDDGNANIGNIDCFLTPELTEGPYYVDVDLIRTNITEGKTGVPLRLIAYVVEAESCAPMTDVVFEIWHADAEGVYSGFQNEGTIGETYLRGAQVTDDAGRAVLDTIYPGWYRGRAVHIHAKVHLSSSRVVTTQFFFPEDLTDEVYANNAPYNTRSRRDTFNSTDSIYPNSNSVILNLEEDGSGGFVGTITIGVA